MSATTSIEWTDRTWNPVRGCARVSPGCENCYAERVAARFGAPGQPYEGLVSYRSKVSGLRYENPKAAGAWTQPRWNGRARFVPEMLAEPLSWRKPQRIFVNSMSDLFHDDVTDEQIAAVFGVMAACPQHTFQILTKRPERAVRWFEWLSNTAEPVPDVEVRACLAYAHNRGALWKHHVPYAWPLPNVWIGVSAEDQKRANERIPPLLQMPAAVRFVSAEPLLGPLNLADLYLGNRILKPLVGLTWASTESGLRLSGGQGPKVDWVIVGGESGPGARPFNVAWARSIVEQCKAAGVACFVKQLGSRPLWHSLETPTACAGDCVRITDRKGGDMSEWPEDLRVREMPEVGR